MFSSQQITIKPNPSKETNRSKSKTKQRETQTMKISLYVVCAAAFLTSGAIAADEDTVVADKDTNENTPIELSVAQMDQITAGTLLLPSGNVVQENFDNPAPNEDGYLSAVLGPIILGGDQGLCTALEPAFCHPALTRRSDTALGATMGHGPSVGGADSSNDGPWAATVVSPVISCPDCP